MKDFQLTSNVTISTFGTTRCSQVETESQKGYGMRGRHAAGLLLSCVVGLSTFQGGCGGGSGGGGGGTPPTQVGISISPTTANVTVGSTKQFTAIVTGTTDGSVDWFVSGVMSGNNVVDQSEVYGTRGVADPANKPGARSSAVSWTDAKGNLWLFGGYGGGLYLNDLWMFYRQ